MLSHIATSYYLERDYLGAFEASRRVVSRFPKYPSAYRWLAASLGQLDRTEEARASLRRAIEISGNFFLHVHTRLSLIGDTLVMLNATAGTRPKEYWVAELSRAACKHGLIVTDERYQKFPVRDRRAARRSHMKGWYVPL